MEAPRIPVPVNRLRLDMLVVNLDEGSQAFIPDPRRYEISHEGDGLIDRKSRLFYPWSIVEQIVSMADTVPQHGPHTRPNLEQLIAERRSAVAETFAASSSNLLSVHLSDEALETMVGGREGFAVVSADAVDSTMLAAHDPDAHARVMSALCSELAEIVGRFGGFVVNFGGDGGVFFFPPLGFCAANDAAYDAARAIVAVHYLAFVPAAREAGLPAIDIRVGADSGDLSVRVTGSETNDRQPDVFGLAISMANRVQKQARPGEVWVGEGLAANVHVSRQKWFEEVETPGDWPFEIHEGIPYRLFQTEVVARNGA